MPSLAFSVLAIIIGISIISLIVLLTNRDIATEHRKSSLDGKQYVVRSDGTPQIRQQVANSLSDISNKIDYLVNYMYDNELPNADVSSRLKNRWSRCRIRETGGNENSVAYTINKGEEMRLCVRKGTGIEDVNTGIFIILHELGHLMSISYGHGDEFKDNFSLVTHIASNIGVYVPQDFSDKPVTYCGTQINTTPCSHGTCTFGNVDIDKFKKYDIPLS